MKPPLELQRCSALIAFKATAGTRLLLSSRPWAAKPTLYSMCLPLADFVPFVAAQRLGLGHGSLQCPAKPKDTLDDSETGRWRIRGQSLRAGPRGPVTPGPPSPLLCGLDTGPENPGNSAAAAALAAVLRVRSSRSAGPGRDAGVVRARVSSGRACAGEPGHSPGPRPHPRPRPVH